MSRAASPPDRVTPGLLLVALLSIAGCAGGQREPDTHDAGPRFDWTTVALPALRVLQLPLGSNPHLRERLRARLDLWQCV